MMRRRGPRSVAHAVRAVRESAVPATPLAAVQAVWAEAVGESIAAAAQPVSERDGVLVVRCESGVWAEQLDLMQGEVLERLTARLGAGAPRRLRCTTGMPAQAG
jgi:predicted nucleic acid-binding Zn ribbon protein